MPEAVDPDGPRGFPEPDEGITDPSALLTAFLDYERDAILRKFAGLTEAEMRRSLLPSGWSPLGLLKHLAHVERRWLQWGFAGERLADPWADADPEGGWAVTEAETSAEVRAFFGETCRRSRRIVADSDLQQLARSGGRFNPPDPHPTLNWILLHLLQEYARHAGHLDVVRELIDGRVGE
ncbi:MAG TPA: DinB family protein [Verrucomicrobiae bacterium]|nr:DinB family protein [Verrucomicrobiae bacterium]